MSPSGRSRSARRTAQGAATFILPAGSVVVTEGTKDTRFAFTLGS